MIHVVCSTLVYQDLLPEMLKGKKNVFEFQIVFNYAAINIVSNQHFFLGFCTQAPILIIGTYFQATAEYNESIHEELFHQYMWRRMYRIMLIICTVSIANYMH
jgi:hypothetical protein